MRRANVALIVASALCMTNVVTAQVPPQGPEPRRPVLSLDFAHYCVGNSWKLNVSHGPPNMPTRLLGNSNGQAWEIAEWRATDDAGSFIEEGTFAADNVGSHTLQLQIGGTESNLLPFVVSACNLKSQIAFVSTRDGGGTAAGLFQVPYIYVANADGSDVRRLTQGAMPAWSADGQRIVFHTCCGNRVPEIRVINADGTNEQVLRQGLMPSWSPDGTKIVFFSATGGTQGGIFTMDADGSNPTQVVSNEFANPGWGDYAVELPSWSPDGQGVAFVRANYEDGWTVHILDLITSEISLVNISFAVGDSRLAWSPDGTQLLVDGPGWSISSVNRDGSGFQFLMKAPPIVQHADWSPDGNSIVFDEFTGPGDQLSVAGSQKRIFVSNLQDHSVRQLIPDAGHPVLPDYWDSQPVWSRVRR